MFASIGATEHERTLPRAGDDLVSPADVVMDRAFTIDAPPEAVWPWLAQLGKRRAGWYLPRAIERFLPAGKRATRKIHPEWQHLQVGDIIPDYGGKHETFQVAQVQAPQSIVYTSQRGKVSLTWSITLDPLPADGRARTRVFLRLRMAPVSWKRLADSGGEFFDALTVAGMAAGLRERLAERLAATPGSEPRKPAGAGRHAQKVMTMAGHLVPGVARVHARVPEFAAAWKASNEQALADTGPLWVVLGDSMGQGIGAQSIRGGWAGQLHTQLAAEGYRLRLVNLSSAGARTRDVVERQLPQLAALEAAPALVTVLAGANDMFPPSRWGDAISAYPQILDALPRGRAVVGTMPRRNGCALAINALIDSAAARGDIRVADMRGMTVKSLIGTRAEDHFHPNERGYADIARRFGAAIDRSLLLRLAVSRRGRNSLAGGLRRVGEAGQEVEQLRGLAGTQVRNQRIRDNARRGVRGVEHLQAVLGHGDLVDTPVTRDRPPLHDLFLLEVVDDADHGCAVAVGGGHQRGLAHRPIGVEGDEDGEVPEFEAERPHRLNQFGRGAVVRSAQDQSDRERRLVTRGVRRPLGSRDTRLSTSHVRERTKLRH
jgi:lysophospholipase L1-like esterase